MNWITDTPTMYRWMVIMDPTKEGGPHVITATAGNLTLTLNDVLFGDVWICSGQSNMQFTVHSVRNIYTHAQHITIPKWNKLPDNDK